MQAPQHGKPQPIAQRANPTANSPLQRTSGLRFAAGLAASCAAFSFGLLAAAGASALAPPTPASAAAAAGLGWRVKKLAMLPFCATLAGCFMASQPPPAMRGCAEKAECSGRTRAAAAAAAAARTGNLAAAPSPEPPAACRRVASRVAMRLHNVSRRGGSLLELRA